MSISVENYPIINAPFLYKYGLTIQNSTVSPLTKLSVLAGNCRDSNDIIDINFGDNNPNLNGFITSAPVRIDNTINGAGGLDSGTVSANTMYAIYIIADSRGYLPVSAIATGGLNIFRVPPGPLMPAGYDANRLIGFWATDNNTFWYTGYYSGILNDLTFTYDTPPATSVTAGSSTIFAQVNLFPLVPDIINSSVSILSTFTPGSAGDTLSLASGRSSSSSGQVVITGQVSGVNVTSISSVIAQPSLTGFPFPVIQYKVSGSDTVAINVAGFTVSI